MSDIKTRKISGNTFYYKKELARPHGPILIAYEIEIEGNSLMMFSTVEDNNDLKTLIWDTPESKRFYYEVIKPLSHHLYLDFDLPINVDGDDEDNAVPQDEIISKIIGIIELVITMHLKFLLIFKEKLEKIDDVSFSWQDASNQKKISLHCIVDLNGVWELHQMKRFMSKVADYIFSCSNTHDISIDGYSEDDFSLLTKYTVINEKGDCRKESAIDLNVYTKERQMRCIHCVKIKDKSDSNRYLRRHKKNAGCDFINIQDKRVLKQKIVFTYPEDIPSVVKYAEERSIIDHSIVTKELVDKYLPGMAIAAYKGGLIQLKNITERKCYTGATHDAGRNGGYIIIKKDGLYFGCHSATCREEKKYVELCKLDIYPYSNLTDEIDKYTFSDLDIILNGNYTIAQYTRFLKNNLVVIEIGNDRLCYHRMGYVTKKCILWKNKTVLNAMCHLKFNRTKHEIIKENGKKHMLNLCDIFDQIHPKLLKKEFIYEPISPIYKNPNITQTDLIRCLNVYPGFMVKYNEYYKVGMNKEIKWILKHIYDIWCKSNDEIYIHLIKYFAFLCQRPFQMTKVYLILRGIEGTGKSCIFEFLKNTIFGDLCVFLSDAEYMSNKFNSMINYTHLLVTNETKIDNARNNILKTLVTDSKITIERKFHEATEERNLLNIVSLTNSHEPIKISANDRRIWLLDVSDEHANDKSYFKFFYDEIEFNVEAGTEFYHYLMNIDITEFCPSSFPETEAKLELKEYGTQAPLKYLRDIFLQRRLHVQNLDSLVVIDSQTLYQDFEKWCISDGIKTNFVCKKSKFMIILESIKLTTKYVYDDENNKCRRYSFTGHDLEILLRNHYKNPNFKIDPDEKINTQRDKTKTFPEIKMRASPRVEPQASSRVEPQASSRVEPQASSRVESQASSRVEPQASSRVESQASSRVEPQASSRVEPQASSRVLYEIDDIDELE